MKAFIACNVLGVFAFNEDGRLIDKEFFTDDPEQVALKLGRVGREIIEEEEKLASRLQGYELCFEKTVRMEGFETQSPNLAGELLRGRVDLILRELNLTRGDYLRRLHSTALAKAKHDLRAAFSKRDRRIMQAIACLEVLDEAINLLMERVKEWHALSVPEYKELTGERGDLLKKAASGDDATLREFAEAVMELRRYRGKLEGNIERDMNEVAPNLTSLVGPLLGAKLITLAKGLENLSRMPGSRAQILGARRAFFRGRKKPPKHGVIFQHPLVRGSPARLRGRIARSLASKIVIAARADVYSRRSVAEGLKRELEERVKRVETEGVGR